jgi:hypothetical protein
MGIIFTALLVVVVVRMLADRRYSALKQIVVFSVSLLLNSCLSITTTRTESPPPTTVVTRTETVYVSENGRLVRRVVFVDANGRRYYIENGRTIYVDHFQY